MFFSKLRKKAFSELPVQNLGDVFILGNGPSLLGHDLNSLNTKCTFASNAIYLAFDRTNWRPDYYSCVDSAVLPDRCSEIAYWSRKLRKCQFILPEFIYTHARPVRKIMTDTLVVPRKNVYYFRSEALNLAGEDNEKFDTVIGSNILRDAMTVTIVLMQLAVKLGANRLFLIGCDTEYTIPMGARVLDQDSPRVDKRIILDRDEDPNHFDSRYFGKGKVWHTPNPELMIKHYREVKAVCDRQNIRVFNAGIGGALDVFPRISYEEALIMSSDKK